MRTTKMLALVFVVLMAGAACQTMTGRTAGQWTEDKATTARVKTALGATKVTTLTRVDVDTVEGVVYLRGKVESDDVKRRAGDVAASVVGRRVVNDLIVDRGLASEPARDTTPAASPTTR
jgi:hypothetical protein